jgi:hypothetical protein
LGHFEPVTVTFSDPSGWAYVVLRDGCRWDDWSSVVKSSKRLDFSIHTEESGSPRHAVTVEYELEDPLAADRLVYAVSSSFGVIARAPMMVADNQEEKVMTDKIHDISQCEREGRDIYSENGELYCKDIFSIAGETTYGFEEGGWPVS